LILGNKSGILAIGVNGAPALTSFRNWLAASYNTEPITYMTNVSDILRVNFSKYKVLYIPSAFQNLDGIIVNGINETQNNALVARRADITKYINNQGGSLVALGQSSLTNAYAWLPMQPNYEAWSSPSVDPTADMRIISPRSTAAALYHPMWHGYFWGPPGWTGMTVLAYMSGKP